MGFLLDLLAFYPKILISSRGTLNFTYCISGFLISPKYMPSYAMTSVGRS
jgi:hypothetical protein